MPGELQFLKGQLFEHISLPTTDLSGRTIIVTGANSGLGLDAAKHLYRMKCGTIILACRNLGKGEEARKEIIGSGSQKNGERASDVEVWELNMASYASVKAFGERAAKLKRLDAAILNAGVHLKDFAMAEGLEETLTVNVTATFLLAILLLPTLRNSAKQFPEAGPSRLEIVGSAVHFWADNKALIGHANGSLLTDLSDEKTANMVDRYYLSKLLVLLCVRQLAKDISNDDEGSKPGVVVNNVAPGFCKTGLFRYQDSSALSMGLRIIGRESEKGARTLIHGVIAGQESHGQYMSEGRVKNCSEWVKSAQGEEIGRKVWLEVLDIAEKIVPGVRDSI